MSGARPEPARRQNRMETVLRLVAFLLALAALCAQADSPPDQTAPPLPQQDEAPALPIDAEIDSVPPADEAQLPPPPPFAERADVQAFVDELALQHGFNPLVLTEQFRQVNLRPNILAIFDRPSTSRPYYQFRPDFVNPTRIRLGVEFWHSHAELIAAVAEQYGVEPEYLVSILGVETLWGRNTGKFRVMDVLSTAAFDYPRRADFFRSELREFLLLAREEGSDPFEFRGSYAGAMGMPQFMPSSYHRFAQDWDGDGHRDIRDNTGDILASVANYFVAHGWAKGQPVLLPAQVEGEAWQPLAADKFNLHYRISELAAFGVRSAVAVEGDPLAVLAPLESAPGVTDFWLGLGNFYALTRYNRSTLYAMAVHELALAIKAAWLDPSLLPPKPQPVVRKANKRKAKQAVKRKKVRRK
jgi:membrane-bound lytic murein transglycosylase B